MRKRTKKIIRVSLLAVFVFFLAFLLFKKPYHPDLQVFSLQEWLRFPSPVKTGAMRHRMKVAAVALPVDAVKERCLANMESMAKKIKQHEPDTRLVVFGESSLGLYYDRQNKRSYQAQVAETIPGAATARIGRIAKSLNMYLTVGLIEKSSDALFNSLVVLDPSGGIIARHRKQCLHEYDALNGMQEGDDQASICDIDGFRVGLTICADANCKSLIKTYKEKRIDILLNSVASNIPWLLRHTNYWPMATEYDSWIISANRFGQEGGEDYSGFIFIADRKGAIHKKGIGSSGYITTIIGKN